MPEMAAGKRRVGGAYNGKAAVIGVRLSHTPPSVGFGLTKPVGLLLRDVVPTATRLTAWCPYCLPLAQR